MLHPRVLFLGDPAAAAPYVGIAKKLARETFKGRIRNKTYQVGEATIRVENTLSAKVAFGQGFEQTFGGISKVWIQAGGTSLIYQFDCTTPTVVFASNGLDGYFPSLLYNSSVYLTIPLLQQPSDTPVRAIPYGSAIEDSGSDNAWRFTPYPMALAENVKLNKKNANHQIQGVNEPVFWLFESDEKRATLPLEKRYAPVDGRMRTYFITEGKLLYNGLSLVCNRNGGSDICYDERGTELGRGRLSSSDTRSPNCDWYQTSGMIKTTNKRYEFTIDASNRLFVWPTKGDYSTSYTIPLYAPQAFLFNVTSPVIVDIPLPEHTVVPDMSFREFYATHVDSVLGRYTQVAPRYHWKVRHDGKKIAAIINLREPVVSIPRFKRWLINDYRYNNFDDYPSSYNPTMLETDFGEAYYHLNPKQAYYNDPRIRFDNEIRQAIRPERTAVVVYSVNLVESDHGSFSVSLVLDSVSPIESTRMPFAVGFAEPHQWSLGIEDGDLLVASVSLTQSETMKRISNHHIGGDTLGLFHAKKDVFVRNERTGLDVFSFCMENSDLDGLLATVDMPTETFSTQAHYFNLSTMSFMFGLRYFDINQQDPMKVSVADVDWYQVYAHHAGAVLVYAYGELVSEQLLHSTRSIDLIAQFNNTDPLTYDVATDWTGNLYGVGSWYDDNDAVRRYSLKGTFWWGEKASSEFSLDYLHGTDDDVVISKAQFETAFRSFNSTVDPHNILPNFLPCTITDFIQQVIDELWWRIEWLAASSDCAITYGLAQFVCENKGLSYFSAGVERFVGICASAVYEIAEQQGFDLDAGQYTEAGQQLQDFVPSFYISDYPLGNHVYHNAIGHFHSDGWYSDVITFPGAYPHISYYSSPMVTYEGTLPILTLGRYRSYIYEINRYVYPDEYALLDLNKFASTSPDGLILYSGHPDKEHSFTHLDLYNQAFKHNYTLNDFYQPPIEFHPGNYRTGVYVKLGDDVWTSLIDFAGGSLAYPIASSKGSPPAYPMLRVNALFTYF